MRRLANRTKATLYLVIGTIVIIVASLITLKIIFTPEVDVLIKALYILGGGTVIASAKLFITEAVRHIRITF